MDLLVEQRRWLHAHAELSMTETQTTAYVRSALVEAGATLLDCPTPTGALAVVRGGPGPSVALRADVDGLPVGERTGRAYASLDPATMHACGHDGHTAVLLEVTRRLVARADALPGDVLLVFQPGEELAGGAAAMLRGGLFDEDRLAAQDCGVPVALAGLHLTSLAPVGLLGMATGTAMSAVDVLTLHVTGSGGHGAMAGEGGVLATAGALLRDLPGVTAGLETGGTAAACSAGTVRAGAACNVLPESAELTGTLRTFTAEQRDTALRRLTDLLASTDAAHGTRTELEVTGSVPAVHNDPVAVGTVETGLRAAGLDPLRLPPVSPSDDVAELLAVVPGCYFLVGAGLPGEARPHHSSTFDLDEAGLPVAADALEAAALALLAR